MIVFLLYSAVAFGEIKLSLAGYEIVNLSISNYPAASVTPQISLLLSGFIVTLYGISFFALMATKKMDLDDALADIRKKLLGKWQFSLLINKKEIGHFVCAFRLDSVRKLDTRITHGTINQCSISSFDISHISIGKLEADAREIIFVGTMHYPSDGSTAGGDVIFAKIFMSVQFNNEENLLNGHWVDPDRRFGLEGKFEINMKRL